MIEGLATRRPTAAASNALAARPMSERERYEAVMIRDMSPPFGTLYGAAFFSTKAGVVGMFRKRNKCRFYNMRGRQIGPEQRNVAPAIAAAASFGWVPLRDLLRY